MKKKLIIILILIILIGGGVYGYHRYDAYKRQEAYQAAFDSLYLEFENPEETPIYEYGQGQIDTKGYIKDHTGTLLFAEPEQINLSIVGETHIKYKISTTDDYGVAIEKEYEYAAIVRDTEYPSIEMEKMWEKHDVSDEIDLKTFVKSVSDSVDGELEYSDTARENSWFIDTSEAIEGANGDFFYLVTAKDKNGNESYSGFMITFTGGNDLSEEERAQIAAQRQQAKEAEKAAQTAKKEAETKAQQEAEEQARLQAEENAKNAAGDAARKAAEEAARRQAEEDAKIAAQRAAEEQAIIAAMEAARKEAEEAARKAAEEEQARIAARAFGAHHAEFQQAYINAINVYAYSPFGTAQMQAYSNIRVAELPYDFSHNFDKMDAAAKASGLSDDGLWSPYNEAIQYYYNSMIANMDYEELAKMMAEGMRNSAGHWSYVGPASMRNYAFYYTGNYVYLIITTCE